MSRSERACFLSHKRLWQRIAHETSASLVLETTYCFPQITKLLDALNTVTDVDYVTLETRARKKLLGRLAADAVPIRRLYQDRSGAAAYVLCPVAHENSFLARKTLLASLMQFSVHRTNCLHSRQIRHWPSKQTSPRWRRSSHPGNPVHL